MDNMLQMKIISLDPRVWLKLILMYLKNTFENKLKNYTNENTLKNKLEGIPKDVIVSESNMIEMDDTNPFAIGHDLFTNEEKNRLKKIF
ncbi:hypothetical protein HZH66_003605 [Vespula vulgaris]|uniref:Uncharacterized protein n=1 Tax=Vespula vulgaris TaxID=7454 RepID=A0A834KH49_VESVU|nr:hypothetical protein HZH66_003605 [Vespula vulgaris]